ncbi:hypothetical protein [Kutzneria chonburiensis]|uniref:Uncharacterized protein n=1 Tax=Kutzneria chonburiensis TaxID=1483604 RepID=A0ABV6MTV9_9PSEU|nr:hypothetical protein [Kutzneria chonburiensis]
MTEEEDIPEPGETKNELTGDPGNVVQARDIRDVYQLRDVYIVNESTPPAAPAPRRHPARMLFPFLPHVIAAVLFGSLAAILAPRLGPVVPAVLVLILYGLVAMLFRRQGLANRCTPEVLREAGTPALVAVAILALLLAAGMVLSPPRLWDGYPERDGIVLAVLLAELAALSAWQVVLRRRKS